MAKSKIPDGLNRDHILSALRDLDNNIEDAALFGTPTTYVLIHNGKRYAPKAAIGLAFRHFTGSVLSPSEFFGGEGPSNANGVLRRLKFDVRLKHDKA